MNLKLLLNISLLLFLLSSCGKNFSVKEKIKKLDPLLVPKEVTYMNKGEDNV